MAFEPITVTVDGKPIPIFKGADVKHALNMAGCLKHVLSGRCIVWDITAGGQTDPGGALYNGQQLELRPKE
jgi:hypothetical protein